MAKISDREEIVTAIVALFGEKKPGYLQDLLTAVVRLSIFITF